MVLQVILSNCNIFVTKPLFLTISACLCYLHIHYKQFCGFYAIRNADFLIFALEKLRALLYNNVVMRP